MVLDIELTCKNAAQKLTASPLFLLLCIVAGHSNVPNVLPMVLKSLRVIHWFFPAAVSFCQLLSDSMAFPPILAWLSS